MEIKTSRDKEEIHGYLSGNPGLYLYLIGDLDDFFWPDTTWFTLRDNGSVQSVALLYTGMNPATLLLFYEEDSFYSKELLKGIRSKLPAKFNVHLGPGLIAVFGENSIIKNYGHNYRMILAGEPEPVNDENIRRLTISELDMVREFYDYSYPGNWFDRRMIETGKYFGYFAGNELAGIAGIHVYSAQYRIAALGNIATLPGYRGKKVAYKLTSVLCTDLRPDTDTIGLNVSSENKPAIQCYKNAGFVITGSYDECLVRNY